MTVEKKAFRKPFWERRDMYMPDRGCAVPECGSCGGLVTVMSEATGEILRLECRRAEETDCRLEERTGP